jgi:hypothetical protein
LFAGGVLALLTVPFLTWYSTEGIATSFPSQVSLIYLFEQGLWLYLTLYLSGVAAAMFLTAIEKKPTVIVGALPAAFPIFTIILQAVMSSIYPGYYSTTQTIGVFTALLGSLLLESSYLVFRMMTVDIPV